MQLGTIESGSDFFGAHTKAIPIIGGDILILAICSQFLEKGIKFIERDFDFEDACYVVNIDHSGAKIILIVDNYK